MTDWTRSATEAVERVSRRDHSLKFIDLTIKQHSDEELAELVDCLLTHPDVVTHVCFAINQLTDETGIKLARYVAASSSIEWLNLSYNKFGPDTYLAVAAALRINSSLNWLYLSNNQAVDRTRIEAALLDALRLNPDRPAESVWQLYSAETSDNDFKRLKNTADQLGHPSLQMMLLALL